MAAQGKADTGFSLVELMVVIVIIAVLVALAVPTFIGARGRANSRSAESTLRNAFTAEKVYSADHQVFADAPALAGVETSVRFTTSTAAAVQATNTVFVAVYNTDSSGVRLEILATNGDCFMLSDDPSNSVRYGRRPGPCPGGSAAVTGAGSAASASGAGW